MKRVEREPTLAHELSLWQQGYCHIAGIDEAGRGALAGPVVAAAVILPRLDARAKLWTQVRDSKQLRPQQRASLAQRIQEAALHWAVGSAPPATIDRINIAAATRQAMAQAIHQLQPPPDALLIDWVRLPQVNIHQQSMPKADAHIVSVAAASILAKVHRDNLMVALDQRYPAYGFARHKGYGTAAHLRAITHHGPCVEHRMTFAPIAQRQTLFDEAK